MARPQNCGKCKKPKRPRGKKYKDLPGYCECGRPTKMDATTLQKLKDAYAIGLNDVKACAYAEICVATLHNYQNENPEFLEEKERLKLRPDLKAQQTIVGALRDPNHAWKWLEKKDKDFMPKSEVKHTGEVAVKNDNENMSDEEIEAVKMLREARRKRLENKTKSME